MPAYGLDKLIFNDEKEIDYFENNELPTIYPHSKSSITISFYDETLSNMYDVFYFTPRFIYGVKDNFYKLEFDCFTCGLLIDKNDFEHIIKSKFEYK